MDQGVNDNDAELFAALRDVWREADPMPPELDAEVLAVLDAALIVADFAVLELVADEQRLVGVRGGADGRTVRFSDGDFEVLVRLASDVEGTRIDGWAVPGGTGTVRLALADRELECPTTESGRFEFAGVPDSVARLTWSPEGGTRGWTTPEFEI